MRDGNLICDISGIFMFKLLSFYISKEALNFFRNAEDDEYQSQRDYDGVAWNA